MTTSDPTPGLYLLDYDGDILSSYEIVTVNSNGLIGVSTGERAVPGSDVAGRLTPLALVQVSAPTSGDHDELLARSALHRSDGMGGGVALIRELETALRIEQSARQAAEEQAIPVFEEANRLEAENDDLRAEIGLMLRTRGLVEITAERDALQQRIDTAPRIKTSEWSEVVRVSDLTAPTESKEPDHE